MHAAVTGAVTYVDIPPVSVTTDQVEAWLATPLARKVGHAAFLDACYHHCGGPWPTWGVVRYNGDGITGAEAFGKWMVDPPNPSQTHLWNTDEPWNYTRGCGKGNRPRC